MRPTEGPAARAFGVLIVVFALAVSTVYVVARWQEPVSWIDIWIVEAAEARRTEAGDEQWTDADPPSDDEACDEVPAAHQAMIAEMYPEPPGFGPDVPYGTFCRLLLAIDGAAWAARLDVGGTFVHQPHDPNVDVEVVSTVEGLMDFGPSERLEEWQTDGVPASAVEADGPIDAVLNFTNDDGSLRIVARGVREGWPQLSDNTLLVTLQTPEDVYSASMGECRFILVELAFVPLVSEEDIAPAFTGLLDCARPISGNAGGGVVMFKAAFTYDPRLAEDG